MFQIWRPYYNNPLIIDVNQEHHIQVHKPLPIASVIWASFASKPGEVFYWKSEGLLSHIPAGGWSSAVRERVLLMIISLYSGVGWGCDVVGSCQSLDTTSFSSAAGNRQYIRPGLRELWFRVFWNCGKCSFILGRESLSQLGFVS